MVAFTHLAVETLLHAGHEHPNALWIAATAAIAFAAGVGIGASGTFGRVLESRSGVDETEG